VAISSNTLLPTARAKITMRIAPGQDPELALALLRNHISENTPFGASVTFQDVELGKPYLVDDSGWAKPLMQEALTQGFGFDSVDIGIGGSIPFIADLVELFPAAQILVTGVEDPDSRSQSPNESVDLRSLQNAMISETLLLLGSNLRAN
jgi:acetylornithine deacetylase/succinyl-diaminopimelate desuccinylase-like protein